MGDNGIGRSFGLAAAVVAAWAAGRARVAVAAPCGNAVVLEGPLAAKEPVARALDADGVTTGGAARCPGRPVRVRLAASGAGFELHVEDAFGRASDRVVADPRTAASLIESWAVEGESGLPVDEPRVEAIAPVALATAQPPAPASGAPARAVRFYGGLASAFGSDSSVWGGGLAGGCARVGRACLGAEVFAARDLGLADGAETAGAARSSVELLLTAAAPLATQRWLLMPRVGLGPAWTRASESGDPRLGPSPRTSDALGFHGAVSVLAGFWVSSRVALALDLGAVVAPGSGADWSRSSWTMMSSAPGAPAVSGRAALACVVAP